jgi:hypothetical protein
MTIDTTVTNGRFVGANGLSEHSFSVHNGVVLETVEFDDVWRTIDASGHLVLPGMIQPGSLSGDVPLKLAQRGTTVVMLSGDEPVEPAAIDCFRPVTDPERPVLHVRDEGALARASEGKALIQLPVADLVLDMSGELWDIVRDEDLPVHVVHGDQPDFPIVQFLYHEGHLARAVSPSRIADVISRIPARWYELYPAKGSVDPGSHGDVFVFDPDVADPYNDSPWPGRIIMSIQRGNFLLYNGQLHAPIGAGLVLNV